MKVVVNAQHDLNHWCVDSWGIALDFASLDGAEQGVEELERASRLMRAQFDAYQKALAPALMAVEGPKRAPRKPRGR